jgi:hypothetical protein
MRQLQDYLKVKRGSSFRLILYASTKKTCKSWKLRFDFLLLKKYMPLPGMLQFSLPLKLWKQFGDIDVDVEGS